ncbi:MAG: alkaline phosphatase PhoX [Longimicrobiales bacterium]
MTISRRRFLGSAAAISLGFGGLGCSQTNVRAPSVPRGTGFGPLRDDPEGIIALPDGFSYRIVSRSREMMSDGFYVPARHDGMATFPGPDGMTLLVRNHELTLAADSTRLRFTTPAHRAFPPLAARRPCSMTPEISVWYLII